MEDDYLEEVSLNTHKYNPDILRGHSNFHFFRNETNAERRAYQKFLTEVRTSPHVFDIDDFTIRVGNDEGLNHPALEQNLVEIFLEPGNLAISDEGGVFSVGNGLTAKTSVGDREYGVIENVLLPAKIKVFHELGHAENEPKRRKTNKKKETKTSSREESIYGGNHYHSEDMMNIMGGHYTSENSIRRLLDFPLRVGYVSPNVLKGKKLYEELGHILKIEKDVFDLEEKQDREYWVKEGKKDSLFSDVFPNLRYEEFSPDQAALNLMKYRETEYILKQGFYKDDRDGFLRRLYPNLGYESRRIGNSSMSRDEFLRSIRSRFDQDAKKKQFTSLKEMLFPEHNIQIRNPHGKV